MSHPFSLIVPLALMLAGGDMSGGRVEPSVPGSIASLPGAVSVPDDSEVAHQVRIEQHFTIRITPGAPFMPPEALDQMDEDDPPPRLRLRHVSRCVPIAGIGAVQGGEGNRLLLFMHDQHVIIAALERTCHASEFYSGFYVERNADGLLCTERDTLQSRSGANCRLLRLNEVPASARRRFP